MSGLRVAQCPDYTTSNPYQAGLISGLEAEGIEVVLCDADHLLPLLAAWLSARPDVMHIHWPHRFIETERRGAAILATVLALRTLCEILLLRLFGVPTVWTIHNELSHERYTTYVELPFRIALARIVAVTVVHCETARDRIADRYRLSSAARRRCVVIPHGNFDPFYARELDREDARQALGLSGDATVLLYFGLIRPYKRVPELTRTFRAISAADARLLVVGNPWTDRLQEEVAAVAAEDNRILTDLRYVPEDVIGTYFAAADAIVLPYDRVLTSGAAVLAMTYGRAVIAPRAGCLTDILEAGGGISYADDPGGGLDGALREAIEDREQLRRIGRRNRRVADSLTWTSVGKRTARLYRSVTGTV